VPELMSRLGKMPPDERKAFGAAVNHLKERVSTALESRKETLAAVALDARLAREHADVTLPVMPLEYDPYKRWKYPTSIAAPNREA
jgi:phenylalanyl-tRNA synthetase alpha chain